VQLAAEVNWLADHVRWDLEEDLARVIGDVPAHTLAQIGTLHGQAIRSLWPAAVANRYEVAPSMTRLFAGFHRLGGLALWAGRTGS
jgi:ubiquinone biosynthesis protein UbiJ